MPVQSYQTRCDSNVYIENIMENQFTEKTNLLVSMKKKGKYIYVTGAVTNNVKSKKNKLYHSVRFFYFSSFDQIRDVVCPNCMIHSIFL